MNLEPLPERALKLLHLGDSYTIGEGVDPAQNWPSQLKNMLQANGRNIRTSKIIARTGWTTTDLLTALRAENLEAEWDLATLCIGVNNQYQGLPLDAYKHELAEIVEFANALLTSCNRLVLLSIPDWSITPFANNRDREVVREEIDQFNEAMSEVAKAKRVPLVQWNALIRQFSGIDNAFIKDGLHPSAKQYAKWAQHLVEQVFM